MLYPSNDRYAPNPPCIQQTWGISFFRQISATITFSKGYGAKEFKTTTLYRPSSIKADSHRRRSKNKSSERQKENIFSLISGKKSTFSKTHKALRWLFASIVSVSFL